MDDQAEQEFATRSKGHLSPADLGLVSAVFDSQTLGLSSRRRPRRQACVDTGRQCRNRLCQGSLVLRSLVYIDYRREVVGQHMGLGTLGTWA